MYNSRVALVALCAFTASAVFAGGAHAGNFDGKWAGKVADWTVSLDVAGAKGNLVLTNCNGGKSQFAIDVAPDGKIDAWLKDRLISRRHFEGRLPSFTIPPSSGSCAGGTAALTRQ